MDNRKLAINGNGREFLKKALHLAFLQSSYNQEKEYTCAAWEESKEHGLILCWSDPDRTQRLPAELSSEEVVPMVEAWLAGDFAKSVEPNAGCENLDHDGDNKLGWEVYVGEWGHVGDNHYAICAIKPAYLWMGK